MSERECISNRVSGATPATRIVLQWVSCWYFVVFTILLAAGINQVFMDLGVHTHPPTWLFLVAHLTSITAALAGWYRTMYTFSYNNKRKAAVNSIVGYALTLSAIGWGLPSLSVHLASQPIVVEAQIYGTSDLTRARFGSCKQNIHFGPWYATGGHVCYSFLSSKSLIGRTVVMQGHGNGWATKVKSIIEIHGP